MTLEMKNELEELAKRIMRKYDADEINFLVGQLRQTRLDEIRKSQPYGAYASASKKCPYCGK